uniref:Uncharacterized protein n=1 Tax=Phocoena sinus TaxID=42100 RepID=A0A8C9E9B1_PHOSS
MTSCCRLGRMGRFQQIQTTLSIVTLLLKVLHNTLQKFTTAIPTHPCRSPADTNLSKDEELDAWLPRDGQGRPKGPSFPNGTEINGTGATEPCTHGWIYDNSTFPSTIVTDPGTWGRGASNVLSRPRFHLLSQAGLSEGADLELPAVSSLRDLCCLHTQLPNLLRFPFPLRHGCQADNHPQIHISGVAAHPCPARSGPLIWICPHCRPALPGWHGLCCAPLVPPAAVGLSAPLCHPQLLQVRGTSG